MDHHEDRAVTVTRSVDDPDVLEVRRDGQRLGEIARLYDRWQIVSPWEAATYPDRAAAIARLEGRRE